MSGKCTENVLRMQMKMLREVQKGIGECCVDENGDKLKSEPTKDSIIRVCRNHATMKHFKEESFEQLREKLDIEWPKKDGPLEYKKLFEEDSEGNQSAFVECLRDLNLEIGQAKNEAQASATAAMDYAKRPALSRNLKREMTADQPRWKAVHACLDMPPPTKGLYPVPTNLRKAIFDESTWRATNTADKEASNSFEAFGVTRGEAGEV